MRTDGVEIIRSGITTQRQRWSFSIDQSNKNVFRCRSLPPFFFILDFSWRYWTNGPGSYFYLRNKTRKEKTLFHYLISTLWTARVALEISKVGVGQCWANISGLGQTRRKGRYADERPKVQKMMESRSWRGERETSQGLLTVDATESFARSRERRELESVVNYLGLVQSSHG